MKLWLISDTFGKHSELIVPKGIDTVCFTGNASSERKNSIFNTREVASFLYWMNKLHIKNKIFCAGRNDIAIARHEVDISEYSRINFLREEECEIDGINFYGIPHGHYSSNNNAYQTTKEILKYKLLNIPQKTDVLLTSIPPFSILDKKEVSSLLLRNTGNRDLRNRVYTLEPKLHVFGSAVDTLTLLNGGSFKDPILRTVFINASCINSEEMLINNGIIIDI